MFWDKGKPCFVLLQEYHFKIGNQCHASRSSFQYIPIRKSFYVCEYRMFPASKPVLLTQRPGLPCELQIWCKSIWRVLDELTFESRKRSWNYKVDRQVSICAKDSQLSTNKKRKQFSVQNEDIGSYTLNENTMDILVQIIAIFHFQKFPELALFVKSII